MDIARNLKKTGRKIVSTLMPEASPAETDILDTLKKEHDEISALLSEQVESTSAAQRRKLLAKVKAALVPHARAEEKVVYDALIGLRNKEAKQDGQEGYLEHSLADRMIATLSKIDNPMSTEFTAAAKVLKELIAHHIKEEERDIWSDMRKHFSEEDRRTMNVKFLQAKKRVRIH